MLREPLTTSGAMGNLLLGFLLLALAVGLYFLPAFVARYRQHHNARAITILNVFLGWTFLGWVASLVWAATQVHLPTAVGPSPRHGMSARDGMTALPAIQQFIDDDAGYTDWLARFPDGAVLDCYRHRPQAHMVLHHATCDAVSRPSGVVYQSGEFTGKQFMKVCSRSIEALQGWAVQQGYRKEVRSCPRCRAMVA